MPSADISPTLSALSDLDLTSYFARLGHQLDWPPEHRHHRDALRERGAIARVLVSRYKPLLASKDGKERSDAVLMCRIMSKAIAASENLP